jgi:hypothetical protein
LRQAERLATRHDVGCRPRWNRRLTGPPTRHALAPTRWRVIVTAVESEVHDHGLFAPQVGFAYCTEANSGASMSYSAVQDMTWLQAANDSEATLSRRAVHRWKNR